MSPSSPSSPAAQDRGPCSFTIYRMDGETDEQALKAAGVFPREGDSVTFWPFAGERLDPRKRIVFADLILGVAARSQPD